MSQIDYSTLDFEYAVEEGSRAHRAVQAADAIGDFRASVLVRVIAQAHEVSVFELFNHSRSRAPIATTRQIAMYMMHVVLGRNLTEVGRFFGRDRTTVAYACSRIEDMRDDAEIDQRIDDLESRFEGLLRHMPVNTPLDSSDRANDV